MHITQTCTKCGVEQPLSNFHPHKSNKSGVDSRCKDCCADKFLRKKYGISLADYNRMLEEQNGQCAICKTEQCMSGRRFCVDHDHKTKTVRGLLCRNCNLALGYFGDDISNLKAAVEYLLNQLGE